MMRVTIAARLAWVAACLSAVAACAGPSDDAARCDAARAHIESCLGVRVPAGTCDAAAAEAAALAQCRAVIEEARREKKERGG